MRDLEITTEHIEAYKNDGFVVFEEFLDEDELDCLKSRFEPLFNGQWGNRSGSGRGELAVQARSGR